MRIRSWPFWILVVVMVSGPWYGIVREPQWARVTWIPCHGYEDKPRDMILNFLLFVPFGWSFVRSRPGAIGILLAMTAAAAVSLAVEIPQLFFRLRDPSATDLLMAICGAAAGSFASQAFYRSDPRRAPGGGEAGERGRQQ